MKRRRRRVFFLSLLAVLGGFRFGSLLLAIP